MATGPGSAAVGHRFFCEAATEQIGTEVSTIVVLTRRLLISRAFGDVTGFGGGGGDGSEDDDDYVKEEEKEDVSARRCSIRCRGLEQLR